MKLNYETIKTWKKIEITTGFDENIRFFFRLGKQFGLELAFFNRLLAIKFI